MTQTADTLRKAKDLISNPENWNKDGDYFKDDDPDSGCMCVYGALGLAMGIDPVLAHDENMLKFSCDLVGMEAAHYNDHPDTTHADIMALFDRAIELAERE